MFIVAECAALNRKTWKKSSCLKPQGLDICNVVSSSDLYQVYLNYVPLAKIGPAA